MKKLTIILSVLCLCVLSVKAGETEPKQNKQFVDVENTGGLFFFQKQPVSESQTQIIRVKKSGGITIIQINGKVKNKKKTEV